MYILNKHGEYIVLFDGKGVANQADLLSEVMAYHAHVLPLQRRRPKIEVLISAGICTTVSQRVHLNVKVLHDQNARIRVRVLDLDDALHGGITSTSKYTTTIVLDFILNNLLILVIVVSLIGIPGGFPGGFPATQSRESLANGETFWWWPISQASFPHVGMVQLQIGFTDHMEKKLA
jgi:hypothetical protein